MTQASAPQAGTVPATTPDVPPVTPLPPLPPLAPTQGVPQAVTFDAAGTPIVLRMPRTQAELDALESARTEISSQINNVSARRNELAQKLRGATPFERQGLEQRIGVLDQRILQLENYLDQTGRMTIAAPVLLNASSGESVSPDEFGLSQGAIDDVAQLSVIFVLGPIAVAFARLIWKRARPAAAPADFTNAAQRLERMEQSVDAIAIEMERVSEGQRFMTRILSEARGNGVPALGVGQAAAQPVPVPGAQAERVRQET